MWNQRSSRILTTTSILWFVSSIRATLYDGLSRPARQHLRRFRTIQCWISTEAKYIDIYIYMMFVLQCIDRWWTLMFENEHDSDNFKMYRTSFHTVFFPIRWYVQRKCHELLICKNLPLSNLSPWYQRGHFSFVAERFGKIDRSMSFFVSVNSSRPNFRIN